MFPTLDSPLVAGFVNIVSLSIATGPASILDQSILEMTSESGLLYKAMDCGQAVITSQSDEEYSNAEYRIELHKEEPSR